ncbi:MAG: glycosyltransferase family 4 protein [Phycisphaerae bacterium]|nr:glycosyltransferase family 4 protein [Phycisphaerae bacterium]
MPADADRSARTILIISQVYVPDPAAVGQHMADAAAELARRGFRVKVLTSARGYENPGRKFPARETLDGVEVRRLPLSSFGKRSIPIRLLGGVLFLAQAVVLGLFTRRLAALVVSTSPPMCPVGAMVISFLRRTPITYWVMDLNPDQMIALGKITADSTPARIFDRFNRMILRRARAVVPLDRFMAERLCRKLDARAKMTIIPPWPPEDPADPIPREANPFRVRHGLRDKFVIMYSGNHGPSSPMTTVIQAALRLQDEKRLVFLFVGGGSGKREVELAIQERGAANIRSLPYQPLASLRESLSAADVHLVTVGDAIVGIVHPSKVYGAMAVGRPILLLGPRPCHVTDLLDGHAVGWRIAHGDVDGAVRVIREILAADPATLDAMGSVAASVVRAGLSKRALCGRFCDVIERTMGLEPARDAVASPEHEPSGPGAPRIEHA